MLFLCFVIVFVVSLIITIKFWDYYDADIRCVFGLIFSVASGIALVVSLILMLATYTGVDGYIAANNERYNSLVYQYENDIYDNDNDLGKRELMTDIQSWNEDLARNKENQDDFWIGIYTPNIYDQFEFIELE